MRPKLLELLAERVVLSDGAMGTRLQALMRDYEGCLDALNTDHDPSVRDLVRQVHESYRDAGADILQTNTFGANPVKLARFGLDDHLKEINQAGAAIARKVAGEDLLVGGSVGPMEHVEQLEGWSLSDIETGFRAQMEALAEGGVDFLVLETFQEIEQARVACRIAKGFDLPVVLQIGGVQDGRTSTGLDVGVFAQELERAGADIIGSNCRGPFDVLRTTEVLAKSVSTPLSAQPNAGSPEIDRGRVVYSIQAEDFGSYAERLLELGVGLIGGCCGTDPSHIERLRSIVQERRPRARRPVVPLPAEPKVAAAPEQVREVNRVRAVLESGVPLVSVEIRPSRTVSFSRLLEGTQQIAEAGTALLDVPDNAGGMVSGDPMTTSALLQQGTGVPTVMHLSSTSRNLIALQSYLMGCWQNGLHGILALTGDHPNIGDHDKYAQRVTDIKSSVDLMRLIGMLNRGKLFNESPIKTPCAFCIGGAINPTRKLDPQIRWLKRKVDAGAEFAFTQPVYLKEHAEQIYEATEDLGIKIFTGLLPISSVQNAEFLASGRIPGITVPDSVMERFSSTDSREQARDLGLRLAEELMEELEGTAHGFYLILPFGKTRFEDTARLVRFAREVLARGPAAAQTSS